MPQPLQESSECTKSSFDMPTLTDPQSEGGKRRLKMLCAGVMAVSSSRHLGREADLILCSCSNDGVLSLHGIDHESSSHAVSDGGIASENLREQESTTAPLVAVKLPAGVFSSPVCFGGLIFLGCRDNCLHCLTIT